MFKHSFKYLILVLTLTLAAACSSPGGFSQDLGPDFISGSMSADLEKSWQMQFVTSNTNCQLDEVGSTFSDVIAVSGGTCDSQALFSGVPNDLERCVAGEDQVGYQATMISTTLSGAEAGGCTATAVLTYTATVQSDGTLAGQWQGNTTFDGNCQSTTTNDDGSIEEINLNNCSASGELTGYEYVDSSGTSQSEEVDTTGDGSTTGTSTGSATGGTTTSASTSGGSTSSSGSTTGGSTTSGSTTGGSTSSGTTSGGSSSSGSTSSGSGSGGSTTARANIQFGTVTNNSSAAEISIGYKITNLTSVQKQYNVRYLIRPMSRTGSSSFGSGSSCSTMPLQACGNGLLDRRLTLNAGQSKTNTTTIPYPVNAAGNTPTGFYELELFLLEINSMTGRPVLVDTSGKRKIKMQ